MSFVPEASADPEGGERPTIDATGPATDPDPFTPEPPDPDLVDIPKGDAGAAATAGEPIVVGGGGGGSISGSVMAYSPDVLHVSNVQGIVVIACHISPPYQACDASKSVAVRLTFGSLRGSYRLDGLLDDTYILLAYKDQNGDGARGPGDWSSTFSMDGRTTTLLTPPVENANLLMVPIEFDKTTLPPPQLDTIAGTWGSQMGDFASAIMHLYLDGTYDYTQSISNLNPNCSLAGDAFYTGTFSLQGTRLRFMPTSPEGGAIGGTCGVGAIGARRSEYFAELWGDEIGRVALYLRASTGPHVLEDVYLLK